MTSGVPGIPTNPEIEAAKADAAEQLGADVRQERLERLQQPEQIDRLRDAEELANIANICWEQESSRRLEQKYGTGRLDRMRAYLAGDREGRFTGVLGDTVLAAARTIASRKTLTGVAALAAVSVFTGGAGLMASGAFAGGAIGRFSGELVGRFRERKAQDELKRAEIDDWERLRQLAVEYTENKADPELRGQILQQIADRYFGVTVDALVANKRQELDDVLKQNEKTRSVLEKVGYFAGLGLGFLGAKALAAKGGVEAGRLAFGDVQTDLGYKMHSVYQEKGVWHFAYQNLQEIDEAKKAGAKGVVELGKGVAGHLFGNSPWKIYAFAAAKALPILGAEHWLAPVLPTPLKTREELQTRFVRDQKAEYERIKPTLPVVRPVVAEPVEDNTRRAVAAPEPAAFFADSIGKKINLVPSPKPENLQIILDEFGNPAGTSLSPDAEYKIAAVDAARNVAALRDEKTGDLIEVDLLKLRNISLPFGAEKPTSAVKSAEVAPPPSDDPKLRWSESLKKLMYLGELESKDGAVTLPTGSVWFVPAGLSLAGTVVAGRGDGETGDLESGRYVLVEADQKSATVVLRPTEGGRAVRVSVADFATTCHSESAEVRRIFQVKRGERGDAPLSLRIEANQRYEVGFVEYRVAEVKDGMVRLEAVDKRDARAPLFLTVVDLAKQGAFLPPKEIKKGPPR